MQTERFAAPFFVMPNRKSCSDRCFPIFAETIVVPRSLSDFCRDLLSEIRYLKTSETAYRLSRHSKTGQSFWSIKKSEAALRFYKTGNFSDTEKRQASACLLLFVLLLFKGKISVPHVDDDGRTHRNAPLEDFFGKAVLDPPPHDAL